MSAENDEYRALLHHAQAKAALERLERPLWAPNPGPQADFLACNTFEALYGGAAGGGKTWALVHDPLRDVDKPTFCAVLIRNSFPELEKTLLKESKRIYPLLGATYNDAKKLWRFPSGAEIYLGYLEKKGDELQYQGAEFQYVGFDELTHYTLAQYTYLISRLRSAQGITSRLRATTNPGGPGHGWVLARWAAWVDQKAPVKARAGEVLRILVTADGERYDERGKLTRTFIPARLADNPKVAENDPDYATRLELLDPVTRAQLLDGRWDIQPAAGLYFRRDWFEFVDAVPKGARPLAGPVRAWDKAATEPSQNNPDPDWTVGVKLSKYGDLFYVENVARMRGKPGAVDAFVRSTAALDGTGTRIVVVQDPGSAGKVEATNAVRSLEGYGARAVRETGSKIVRASPVSAQASPHATGGLKGRICIVKGAWNEAFLQELEAFPDGDHDDQVDALSTAFTAVAEPPTPRGVGARSLGIF